MNGQRGIALATSLAFLTLLTLVSVTAMRASVLELREARHAIAYRADVELAQALVDAVVDNAPTATLLAQHSDAHVNVTPAVAPQPPARALASSARLFSTQSYRIDARVGSVAVSQGFVVIVQADG